MALCLIANMDIFLCMYHVIILEVKYHILDKPMAIMHAFDLQ